jgi:hypothetical protein
MITWGHWVGRTRTLADIADPIVRSSALWLAHALMAATHIHAPDRPSGPRPQERQRARLSTVALMGLQWLADRISAWPRHYRRHHCIAVRTTLPATRDRSGVDRNC